MTDVKVKKNCFTVFNSKLEGRLDPDFYNPFFYIFFDKLNKSKYDIVELADISKSIFQGVGKDETKDTKYTLLKVKNILPNNVIDYTNTEFVADVPENKILKEGDIISPFIGEAVRICKFSIFNQKENKNLF